MSGFSRVVGAVALVSTLLLGAVGPRPAAGVVVEGACCFRGQCAIVDAIECEGLEGSFQGEATDCSVCPPGGACCLPDFQCSLAYPEDCAGGGGTYQGDFTDCTACPQPSCEVAGDPCSDCDGCTCGAEVVEGGPAGELLCAQLPGCLIEPPMNCLDTIECPPDYSCVDAVVVLGGDTTWNGVCCPTVTTVTTTSTTTTTLPLNDDCFLPDPIAGCEITVPFDNDGATTDGLPHAACLSFGSQQVYSDLWYCWDPPYDAQVAVQTCGGTSLDTRLNVYGPFADCAEAAAVCPAGDGDLLECNDDACALQSRVEFPAEDGNVYLVRLGSWSPTTQGSGAFEVTCQEDVDMCTPGTPGGVCQLPNPTSNGTNAVTSVTGETMVADDFVPTVDADITHLAWWGIYGLSQMGPPSDCGPGAGDTFTVTYYEDAGGVPGAILAGPMPVTALAKCATGEQVQFGPGMFDEYEYQADHAPVPVQGGMRYWVSIGNVTPEPACRWRWRTSDEGNGTYAFFQEGWEASTPDLAFCYNTIRRTCRTAGYYMTHSTDEDGSRDVTGELLEAAGCLEICGEVIRTTNVDDADSAVEALCESPRGTQERQLARQLTALGLNCIASGYGPLCRGWPGVEELFAECNAVCELGPNAWTVEECIEAAACVNSGGDPFATPGACYTGTCSDNQAPCSPRDRSNCAAPSLATCEPDPDSCHEQDICNAGLGVCVPPGTSANPTVCKMAKMSACSVLEVGRTTEDDCSQGVRLDEESCCNDPAECDDGELCTADQCVVGPGCDNQPIPLCCESNADCANPLPTCDVATNTCMECVKDEDCDDQDACTDDFCVIDGSCNVVEIPDCCQNDDECVDPTPICHPMILECVACVDDEDCPPSAPYCNRASPDPASLGCFECESSADCDDGVDCTMDRCVGPGVCINPPGPVPPGNPCEQNCICDPVLGRTCEPVPNCCLGDLDCPTPGDVCIDFECGPPGEREACGEDNNGGCNTSTSSPPYDPVACGETVSGNAWADGGTRDTDWYLLSVPDPDGDGFTRVQANPTASDEVLVFIVDGIATCTPEFKGDVGCAGPGVPTALADAVVPAPGDYVVFVATGTCDGSGIFDGIACPGATYSVDVTCSNVTTTTTSTSTSTTTSTTLPVCGDAVCDPAEVDGNDPDYCAADCCGDGLCTSGEDDGFLPNYCAADCCGDGTCFGGEGDASGNPNYCAPDCCGDGNCTPGEDAFPNYCAADCCGDGFCTTDERDGSIPEYCAADCCGDGECSTDEELVCPEDCCVDNQFCGPG